MNRHTTVTENGVIVGGVEYTEPTELVEALIELSKYEDMTCTAFEMVSAALRKSPFPEYEELSKDCKYHMDIPNVGLCCKAYSKGIRIDGLHWANYHFCSEEYCPLVHPELLECAKLV